MKKLVVMIAVLGLAFASCNKDRVCSCKTVTVYKMKTSPTPPAGMTAPAGSVNDYSVTLADASLKTANRACIHTKSEGESTYYTYTRDNNCSLQ